MLGNLSKYIRAQPNSGALLHLAYIPSVSPCGKIKFLRCSTLLSSSRNPFTILHQPFIRNGDPRNNRSYHTVVENSCTPSGEKFLMMISFMHILMGLLSDAWMELNAVYIHVSSLILQTILRSKQIFSSTFQMLNVLFRVLLATIRDNGLCPCPRCLVSKGKLDCLGLQRDIMIRIKEFRVYAANKVNLARRSIYRLAKPITGSAVEDLLKSFSGVPTEVLFLLFSSIYIES